MTLKLGEVLVDQAMAKLRAHHDAACAQVNATLGGDPQINAADDSSYYTGGTAAIPAGSCPAVIVAEGPGTFEGEGADGVIWEPILVVRVIEEDHTIARLRRKLQRQSVAVIQALVEAEPRKQLAGAAHYIFPFRTEPGAAFEPDNEIETWRAHYDIVFACRQYEDL